jgi:hypothetical protein
MSLPLITTIDHSGSYPQQANMSASMCGPTQHQVNLFKFQDWRKRRTVFPNVILAQGFCLLSLFRPHTNDRVTFDRVLQAELLLTDSVLTQWYYRPTVTLG